MQRSVGLLVTEAAARFGDKTALVFDERRFSFRDLDEASSRIASALHGLGVRPGDRVSLYAPNSPEWVIAYYGVQKAAAIVNPLNLMLTPEEAAFAMGDCGAVAVLGSREKLAGLAPVLARTRIRHCIAWGDRLPDQAIGFDALLRTGSSDWTVAEADPLLISTIGYTSGTTGHPKGAELTHRAILLNTAMTATMHVRTAQDVVVSALPCSHVYGNIVLNAAIAYGMTLILHAIFEVDKILTSIQEHRATLFEGVPTMYLYMLAWSRLRDYDLSSLTRCTVGGQTMPVAKLEEVVNTLGCPLIELWGMTELGGLGATHSAYGPSRLGSIGVPLPHLQLRINSSDHPELGVAAGTVGELQVRGPMVMQGYLNGPEATAESMTADGWMRTGDLARSDEDGYFYIVDRMKDMIITAGFNIYPAELERAIAEHPGVALVAVCGIRHELKGEVAKAYVVARPGVTVDAEMLERHCRERLAAYKVPREFQFVDDLPKTSSGKVARRALPALDSAE